MWSHITEKSAGNIFSLDFPTAGAGSARQVFGYKAPAQGGLAETLPSAPGDRQEMSLQTGIFTFALWMQKSATLAANPGQVLLRNRNLERKMYGEKGSVSGT